MTLITEHIHRIIKSAYTSRVCAHVLFSLLNFAKKLLTRLLVRYREQKRERVLNWVVQRDLRLYFFYIYT